MGRSAVAVLKRTRTMDGKTTVERRHYLSSLPANADKIAHAARSHGEVENRQHWCLDVQFGDDNAHARSGHIAHNFALVRHMALNLIRLHTSIKFKRLLAATSDEFRATLHGLELPDEDYEVE